MAKSQKVYRTINKNNGRNENLSFFFNASWRTVHFVQFDEEDKISKISSEILAPLPRHSNEKDFKTYRYFVHITNSDYKHIKNMGN